MIDSEPLPKGNDWRFPRHRSMQKVLDREAKSVRGSVRWENDAKLRSYIEDTPAFRTDPYDSDIRRIAQEVIQKVLDEAYERVGLEVKVS